MKLKQLINGGALAATVLTLGSAQAEKNPFDGIVFCKATITDPYEGEEANRISVILPFTTTGHEGQQYTHWNLGNVPAGGVADSWHSEGGPGKFMAHNNGSAGAYVYLTSSFDSYRGDSWYNGEDNDYHYQGPFTRGGGLPLDNAFKDIFGNVECYGITPIHSLTKWQQYEYENCYCLAFTRDMNGKLPTWHMLNRWYWTREDGSYYYAAWDDHEDGDSGYIGAYMGYLAAGDYMPFDVKFWAPHQYYTNPVGFTFRVEAAAFPLWEHDIEVQ